MYVQLYAESDALELVRCAITAIRTQDLVCEPDKHHHPASPKRDRILHAGRNDRIRHLLSKRFFRFTRLIIVAPRARDLRSRQRAINVQSGCPASAFDYASSMGFCELRQSGSVTRGVKLEILRQ